MSGNNIVVDTNILLYIIGGVKQTKKISEANLFISEMTEIEMLGNKDISEIQFRNRTNIIDNCLIINMSTRIKRMTIGLKQKYNIKVPDAIIAATAIYLDLPFVTADKGFKKIQELDLQLLDLK
jgi:predicted nucleic acid-binding protein